MKNNGTVIEYIMAVLGYVSGVALCISLVFLPLGIYMVVGANYYLMCTKLSNAEISIVANHVRAYSIFFSIMLFPIGLLSLFIVPLCKGNKVSVENRTEQNAEGFVENTNETSEHQTSEATQRVVSEEELEKFNQLKKYREQGIITEEEFRRAKDQLFGE